MGGKSSGSSPKFSCVYQRRLRKPVTGVQTCALPISQTIGTVDSESALWMVHPGAIYLHEAQQYFVKELNLEEHIARLRPIESDYYTEPLRQTTIALSGESNKIGRASCRERVYDLV